MPNQNEYHQAAQDARANAAYRVLATCQIHREHYEAESELDSEGLTADEAVSMMAMAQNRIIHDLRELCDKLPREMRAECRDKFIKHALDPKAFIE